MKSVIVGLYGRLLVLYQESDRINNSIAINRTILQSIRRDMQIDRQRIRIQAGSTSADLLAAAVQTLKMKQDQAQQLVWKIKASQIRLRTVLQDMNTMVNVIGKKLRELKKMKEGLDEGTKKALQKLAELVGDVQSLLR